MDNKIESLEAWPRRGTALFLWIAFLFGVALLGGFYVFDVSDIGDVFLWTVKLGPLLFPFAYFLTTSSILLFTWKPLLRIGEDKVVFPLLGLTIHRSEVIRAVSQSNGLSDNWRVVVELTQPKPGRFRIYLLYPAAAAFRNKIYVFPIYMAEPRAQVRDAVIQALTGNERQA